MTGNEEGSTVETVPDDEVEDRTIVRCSADAVGHGLDVDWTRGAIFEFESVDAAQRWVTAENQRVPGTLFLSEATDTDAPIPIDHLVKYRSMD